MHISKKKIWSAAVFVLMFALLLSMTVFAADGEAAQPKMYATFWALIPPVVAIALALITKEVYSSLFVGILVGAMFYSDFSFEGTIVHIFKGGIISVLSNSYNVEILVFLIILGAMVSLMNRAGGSAAFGKWAGKRIKTRVGAQLATIALGMLIFIDDYFNCLTVGSVMQPVTDRHQVSRAKLSYLIDATAAPICIIAPISSWAAAVTGFVEGEDGFSIFMRAIPYNFYALLTILMMIAIVVMKFDFGTMRTHEKNAVKGDIFTTANRPYESGEEIPVNENGKVTDLLIPIASLIVCCVIGMIYTGGFFDGVDFVTAFSNSDASVGLVLGSFFGLVLTIGLYCVRKVLTFKECMECIPEGFKAMVPAIMYPDICMDLESDDRQSRSGSVCCNGCESVCGRIDELPSGDHFPDRMLFGICHGNFLGNFWNFDSDCRCDFCRDKRDFDDHFHLCMYGRSGMRGSLFSDFRYDDHGICRCAV